MSCARSSAWCCRTCTCSAARSPTTSGSARRRSPTPTSQRAAAAVHADSFVAAPAGRLRGAGGRARRHALGRPEAAAVVRPRPRVRSAHPRPRRSDVERGHRDRDPDPRRAARPDVRPDDDRHRAPALDHPGHGQDPRPAQGSAAGGWELTRNCSLCGGSISSCTSCSTRIRRRALVNSQFPSPNAQLTPNSQLPKRPKTLRTPKAA